MNPNEIVFTATNIDRNIEYTLCNGTSKTIGWEHIKHRRPFMKDRLHAVKYAVENTEVAIMDKEHMDRERLYCMGADSKMPNHYMAVLVEYTDSYTGNILTAFPEDKIPDGGEINYVKIKK